MSLQFKVNLGLRQLAFEQMPPEYIQTEYKFPCYMSAKFILQNK